MKKILLFVFAIFLTSVHAQQAQTKWSVEEKAGMNISYLGGGGVSNAKIGFRGGALLGRFINDKFSIKSGLLYDQRGFRLKMIGESDKLRFNVNALTIPILVQYESSVSERVKLFVYGGPFFSFMLNTKQKVRGVILNTSENERLVNQKIHNTFDVGLESGVGLLYSIGDNLEFVADIGAKSGFLNYFTQEGAYLYQLGNIDTGRAITRNVLYDLSLSVGLRQRF